ncbi:MAG: multiheme c-type cytochrome [Planctomycetia bacterium]|nr:multiheme c-type cytochrome [Planctomycetia bacterium]
MNLQKTFLFSSIFLVMIFLVIFILKIHRPTASKENAELLIPQERNVTQEISPSLSKKDLQNSPKTPDSLDDTSASRTDIFPSEAAHIQEIKELLPTKDITPSEKITPSEEMDFPTESSPMTENILFSENNLELKTGSVSESNHPETLSLKELSPATEENIPSDILAGQEKELLLQEISVGEEGSGKAQEEKETPDSEIILPPKENLSVKFPETDGEITKTDVNLLLNQTPQIKNAPAGSHVASGSAEILEMKDGCPEGYRPSQRNYGKEPFDPIKENGDFFVGWPKPDVTLVFTGRLNGYMEPCGCAGLDRMNGGLSRRATFLNLLRQQGWNPVVMDTGGISVGFSQQARMKYQTTVNMFREMNYDAITLGTSDLNFPAGDILSEISTPAKNGNMFLSANVGIFAMDSQTLPPMKIIERNGIKIGIIGVLGDEEIANIRNDEIVYHRSVDSLKKIVPTLKKSCDFLVLLAHATDAESRTYAKELPEIDIIVTSSGPPVPPSSLEVLPETKQYYITIGEKGTHLITLGIYRDNEHPVRYQRVALDSRYKPSPKFMDLMALYQEQLKHSGLKGLGIRPLPNPYTTSHGDYVGSARCESCHEEVYIKWQKSRHGKAWRPLRDAVPARTSDPECVVCHVVGWNIEHMIPYQTGYLNEKDTPHLRNVGCETCHGPGSKHIAAELGNNTAEQEQYREAARISLENAKKNICVTCHDLDNSPNFDFELYWKCIEHKENTEEE